MNDTAGEPSRQGTWISHQEAVEILTGLIPPLTLRRGLDAFAERQQWVTKTRAGKTSYPRRAVEALAASRRQVDAARHARSNETSSE